MNLKTTVTLLLLLALGGGVFWYVENARRPSAAASETLVVLEKELQPDRLSRIEIGQGDNHLILERGNDNEWTLPGKWPTRRREVGELVELLTNLRSRFAPTPLTGDKPDLKPFGLDPSQSPLRVSIRGSGGDSQLLFGEKPDTSNRFSSPTFLRVEGKNEVIRLAPGIVAALQRPIDYYQQRHLFPSERVTEGDTQEKVDKLAAKTVTILGGINTYSLERQGDNWNLQAPVRDAVDPDKLKTILTAMPDIWAEQFVQNPKALSEYGLDKPERKITVGTDKGGKPQTLLIGKKSQTKDRTITKPPPPNPRGFPQQMPPTQEIVHEDYYFAKLEGNDQIFEIKDEKLKELFVSVDTLRDAKLARFRAFDAQKLEVSQKGQEMVFAKENGRWKVQKPFTGDAEESKIDEILNKLSDLNAKDKDILDKAAAKAYGLDAPAATIKVMAEESTGEGDKKVTKKKSYTFTVGKHDPMAKKLYVRVAPFDRINAVDDGLSKLLDRPALAYRGRRVLDVNSSDLAKIEIQRSGEKYTLEQVKDNWKLVAPETAETDGGKVNQLVNDLARLEAVEFVTDAPKAEDLDKEYGLAKPAVTATLTFTAKDKPAQKVLVGKPRGDKGEYFAKLESGPAVFVIKKETHEALDRSSLALLPAQPWKLQADEIAEVRLDKEGNSYRLKRDGKNWKITEPFEAAARTDAVQPLIDGLAKLSSERYEAHTGKQLGNYGLDKPYLRLVVTPAAKPEGDAKDPKEKPKERVLLIGKPTADKAKSRFAKLGDSEAVFVVGDKLVSDVDHNALELLDRKLLALEPNQIQTIKSTAKDGSVVLEKKSKEWEITAPAVAKADRMAIGELLNIWFNLQAERFVDYGSKLDAVKYGFDKPSAAVTVSVTKPLTPPSPPGGEGDKKFPSPPGGEVKGEGAPTTETHTLVVGNPVSADSGERFARLDNVPGVFVLNAATAANLTRSYLDYLDRSLLQFDASTVTALQRKMGSDNLEVVKRDSGWEIAKPQTMTADAPTMDDFLQQLGSLRAEKIAAYQAKDLKPFGLEAPAAVVMLKLGAVQHTIALGQETDGHRYIRVDQSPVIAVLPAGLTKQLVAGPLAYRDRTLANFADADRLVLERGPREATFTKVDGTWKLTKPLNADAEQADLEEFINAFARLRADELVADKPDNKVHGLDKPQARWRFQAGDKVVLDLVIGNAEPGGPRHYAKLGKSELVFLLNPKMTGQALAEYRQRSVWPSLDVAQVDAIRYGYARNPFLLEKQGTNWTVAGKAGAKINTSAVSETLDALARLRLERYVVDKGADLKLYGLEPPYLALEVQSPSGKKVLHLGRTEGDSKRYYAHVADNNNYEVFLIAEADAARIVRDLAAFEDKAPKIGTEAR